MKFLILTTLILFISFSAYAEKYPYPNLTLELKGDTVILKQRDNIFTYPPQKQDEYAGIEKVLKEDLDGDGKEEYILAVQLTGIEDLPAFPYSVVLISTQRENKLDIQKQIVLGNCLPDFELADADKDGLKDVIATGFEYAHWKHLKIASWKNGKFVLLWDKGEDGLIVEQSFGITENGDAQIKVGFPRYIESEGKFDGYEPQEWEIYLWDGEKFALIKGNK